MSILFLPGLPTFLFFVDVVEGAGVLFVVVVVFAVAVVVVEVVLLSDMLGEGRDICACVGGGGWCVSVSAVYRRA